MKIRFVSRPVGCVVALCLLLTTLVAVPVGADTIPAACGPLDPTYGNGGVINVAQDDGYFIDRLTMDTSGRLYVNSIRIVDDSYALDRIRRYTTNGLPDRSWGGDGVVDLNRETFSAASRTMAVDAKGRLWFSRAIYADNLQIMRFSPSGVLDDAFGDLIETSYTTERWDPVGDMAPAPNNGVIIGYGRHDNNGSSYVQTVRISEDGHRSYSQSPVVAGKKLYVIDVLSPNIAVGQAASADLSQGFSWQNELLHLSTSSSLYAGIARTPSPFTMFGWTAEDGADVGVPVTATIFDIVQDSPDEVATPTLPGVMLAYVGADRFAVGLSDNRDVYIGSVNLSGEFVGDPSGNPVAQIQAQSLVPVAVQKMADGSHMIGTYFDYQNDQVVLMKTLPDNLGPVVASSALRDQVRRLYLAYFLREPDESGLNHWRRQRASSATLEDVSNAFAQSAEFLNRYGDLSDHDFVKLVYQNVLSRQADSQGLDFWAFQLTSEAMTRGEVMVGFSESAEYIRISNTTAPHWDSTGAVHRLYGAYFKRSPDPSGLCYWSLQVDAGAPLTDVSQAFATSQEFQTTYGALSNQQFVELIYRNILDRAGEPSGVEFWTYQLSSGTMTRGQVMVEFSEASENILRTGTLPAD